MTLSELQEIKEQELASRKKKVLRCCMAAGCVSQGSDELKRKLEQAVKNAKAGQVRYRTDKGGIIHCTIGKVDFKVDQLRENLQALKSQGNRIVSQYSFCSLARALLAVAVCLCIVWHNQ